ncbi:MAG TPA: PEP-CTERM sorting domain-containing protein [Pirellulales bacterium]|nr:PEP-CTERM sorting domain-containing protein [Pirellulales bacterium]
MFAVVLASQERAAWSTEFSVGDLVVTQIGATGSGTALTNKGTAAFLDEISTSGASVQQLALPTAASGSNNPLTLGGTAASEGELSLSANGQFLVGAGYDVGVGGTTQGESTVGLINNAGSIDTTTTTDALGGNNTRSATSDDGNEVWIAGPNGLVYTTLGSSDSTALSTKNIDASNLRSLSIVPAAVSPTGVNELLASSNKTDLGVEQFSPAEPASGKPTGTMLPGMTATTAPNTYAFFFTSPNTMFVADATVGLQEWTYSSSAATWTNVASLGGSFVGLTGIQTGNTVTLYATTGSSAAAGWAPDNSLVKDLFTFDSGTSGTGSFGAPITLATATGDSGFSGVAFAPGPGPGAATIDNSGSGTFGGTVLSYSYAVGGSYAGVSTQVASQTSGTTVGGPIENTVATILAGNNSGSFTANDAASVSMTWRNRTLAETPMSEGGSPASPLISDVVNLYGMASAATGSPTDGPVQSDPFVLQLTFDPATLGSSEATTAAAGGVYLAWLNPNGGGNGIAEWQHANTGDTGGIVTSANSTPSYVGSFVAFLNSLDGNSSYPLLMTEDYGAPWTAATIGSLSNAQLNEILGAWGVDPTDQDAWAVLNHNSEFAVVPEPPTLLLAALAVAGLAVWAGFTRRLLPT